MPIKLRPYQADAVNFLLSKNRAILGDAVGVGKTFAAIAAAGRVLDERGGLALIVVPAYLMRQWKDAIQAYFPDDDVTLLYRDTWVPDDTGFATPWVVTSYHTFQSSGLAKQPRLVTTKWPVVVFDEAHRLRGRNSQWTKNAYRLKADRLWMLTGTPIVNNPGDLYPLLHLCDRQRFRSYWDFVQTWCVIDRTPWATEVLGVKPILERAFHDLLDEFVLRRRVEDVLPDLPPTIEHMVPVDLPKAVKKAHDKAKTEWFIAHPDLDDPVVVTSGGALVHKLRQLTAGTLPAVEGGKPAKDNPKRDAVLAIIDDLPNEPVVVFCAYKATAELIHDALATRKEHFRPVTLATGDLTPYTRAVCVERWKLQPNGVLVATIPALQEGANLQHAHAVVFAEHSYLPADIEQAIARCRRFGQEYPVNVYHVYARGTVDEAVIRAAQRREKHVERALLADLKRTGDGARGGDVDLPFLPPIRTVAAAALLLLALSGLCSSLPT